MVRFNKKKEGYMFISSFLATLDVFLYAIVGGPSVGKTSILNVLKERGEIVCEEAATDIILQEREQGNLTPWLDEGFELKIFSEKLRRENHALRKAQLLKKTMIFTDRGLLDTVVYLKMHNKEGTDEYQTIMDVIGTLQDFSRYKFIFYVEPHSGLNFQTEISEARHESTEEALKIATNIQKVYGETAIKIITVPSGMTPDQRADFVLNAISNIQKKQSVLQKN